MMGSREPENHAMHKPLMTAMLLAAVLFACGAADKEKARDKPKEDEKPACMHCGATCGLEPICVCEPTTKKQPKVEFDVKCEPICVAGCSSKPWPFGRCHERVGCTSCCEEPCRCPGWVRNCKKLKKETTDEEVPTIKRKVAYICDCCSGECTAGCCGVEPGRQWLPSWCTSLTLWWPRKPTP